MLTPEEEDELKRRQLEELRTKQQRKEQDRKTTEGCTSGCFGLVVLIVIVGWIVHSCSGSGGGASSSSRSSSSDLRTQRVVAQKYWNGIIGNLAFAGAAIGFAGEAAQQGDSLTAQQLLSRAQTFADNASSASLNGAPDGWEDISSDLYSAAGTYKKAIGELKDGLGTGDSEKTAAAVDDASSAGSSINNATHNARIWYEQHGGKWSDIEDYQTAEQSVSSSLKSLENR